MIQLTITLNVDEKPWVDAKGVPFGDVERLGRIPRGTESGLSAVVVCIRLPDGSIVVGQTTLTLLEGAVGVFRAADERARKMN